MGKNTDEIRLLFYKKSRELTTVLFGMDNRHFDNPGRFDLGFEGDVPETVMFLENGLAAHFVEITCSFSKLQQWDPRAFPCQIAETGCWMLKTPPLCCISKKRACYFLLFGKIIFFQQLKYRRS